MKKILLFTINVFLFYQTFAQEQIPPEIINCGCTHYIKPEKGSFNFDGYRQTPKVKAGDVLCFKSDTILERIILKNLIGTKEKPIIIKNCGGVARIVGKTGANYDPILVQQSKHLKVTGTGDYKYLYGIKIEGAANGISLTGLTTDIEVDHIEISKTGFAGIMAKTDPTCKDPKTWRENFTMYNVSLHHNYIHDIGGEGFYVGNSFYVAGHPKTSACSKLDSVNQSSVSINTFKKYAHIIIGVDIYRNIVKRAGCEGIQVGSAPINCKIHDNIIDTSGIKPFDAFQNNGLQIGNGTGGSVYNNFIRFSPGNGISCLGIGDNLLYNNIIIHSGSTDSSTYGSGIFMDEQAHPDSILGPGMKFINNTIIDPLENGIRIYNNRLPSNMIYNNIVVHLKTSPIYVYPLNKDVIIDSKTNLYLNSSPSIIFSKSSTGKDIRAGKYIDHIKYLTPSGLFKNPKNADYRINNCTIASDNGTNVSSLLTYDINNYPRFSPKNDIGAFSTNSPLLNINQKSNFFVYPTPSVNTDSLTFTFYIGVNRFISVKTYDNSGKLLQTYKQIQFGMGWNNYTIQKNSSIKSVLFELIENNTIIDSQNIISGF